MSGDTLREALACAAQRIEAGHRALLPKDVDFTDATGTRLGARGSDRRRGDRQMCSIRDARFHL